MNTTLPRLALFASALFCFLFLTAPWATAQGWRSLPITSLPEIRGDHADEIAFAKQVGAVLNRYSSRTDFEACADLCRAPSGAWGAKPTTIGGHAACLVVHECPAGMRRVGRSIHSHPITRRFLANEVDFRVWGRPYVPNTWVTADDPTRLSESDLRTPGYVVVYGQLYRHQGPGRVTELGRVSP